MEGTIIKLNNFLEYSEITDEEVNKIIEKTSYDNMKKTHDQLKSKTTGTSGGYKQKLTNENIMETNKKLKEFLDKCIDDKGLNLNTYIHEY